MTEDLFAGLDAPRPLPDALRRRLEEQLLDTAPRALPESLRTQLHQGLAVRRSRRVPVAAAALVAMAASVAAVLVLSRPSPVSRPQAVPAPVTPTLSAEPPSGTTDGTAQGGGSTGGAAAPVPTPLPSPPAGAPAAVPAPAVGVAPRSSSPSPAAPPHLDTSSPSTGATGSWVILDGSALSQAGTVRFGTTASPEVQVISDARLRVRVPVHGPGSVDVTVTTPGGTSNAVRFVYLP